MVRRGRIGLPSLLSENLRGRGANSDRVPVPVLNKELGICNERRSLAMGTCLGDARRSRESLEPSRDIDIPRAFFGAF